MSGRQLCRRAPGPRGSPALGCCQGRGARASRARSCCLQGWSGAELCCSLCVPRARHRAKGGCGEVCIFEVLQDKGEHPERVPAAVRSSHTRGAQHFPWMLANHLPSCLVSPQKCSDLPFPRHLQGGDPAELGAVAAPEGPSPAATP